MASSIFGNSCNNSILAAVNQLKAMGSPQQAFNYAYQNNPQFRQFADAMQGKTPEQAFSEHGLDFNQVKSLF